MDTLETLLKGVEPMTDKSATNIFLYLLDPNPYLILLDLQLGQEEFAFSCKSINIERAVTKSDSFTNICIPAPSIPEKLGIITENTSFALKQSIPFSLRIVTRKSACIVLEQVVNRTISLLIKITMLIINIYNLKITFYNMFALVRLRSPCGRIRIHPGATDHPTRLELRI